MDTEPLIDLPPNRPSVLRNTTCAYCGVLLNRDTATKEHVIARRFVPRGTLSGNWNLVLRACRECNTQKSDLEDDISAITMHPDMSGDLPSDDPRLLADSPRKAKSFSRRTNKRVAQSHETVSFEAPLLAGLASSFSLVGPPQVDADRVMALAALHITALFYWLSYDSSALVGGFWPGRFTLADYADKKNWGNAVQLAFMKTLAAWEPRLQLVTAEGFFEARIAKSPTGACWAWALEWNMNLRLVGFFGDEELSDAHVAALPPMPGSRYPQADGSIVVLRRATALDAAADTLFGAREPPPVPDA